MCIFCYTLIRVSNLESRINGRTNQKIILPEFNKIKLEHTTTFRYQLQLLIRSIILLNDKPGPLDYSRSAFNQMCNEGKGRVAMIDGDKNLVFGTFMKRRDHINSRHMITLLSEVKWWSDQELVKGFELAEEYGNFDPEIEQLLAWKKRVGNNYIVCFGNKIMKNRICESKVDCRVRLCTGKEENIVLALEKTNEEDNPTSNCLTIEALKQGYDVVKHVMIEGKVAKQIQDKGKDIFVAGEISEVTLLNNELACEELNCHSHLPQNLPITISDDLLSSKYTISWEKQDKEMRIEEQMCYENVLHALELFKKGTQDDNDVSFRRSANLTIFLYLNPLLLK